MDPKNKLFDFARARPAVEAGAPLAQHSSASNVSPVSGQTEFTDTVMFRSPTIEVNRDRLEAQRILSPGAGGAIGSPYKMLRTQVLRRLDQLGANTLAVMSPTEGAGKTLTAINLAIAIAAETGRTALLVDLDLRNPNIHRRFGFKPELGVEECLLSRQPVQDAMIKVMGYERLTVLPARSRVENSSELLSDQTAAQLLQELRNRYANRVIIFDLPPVLQADDALAFSRHVQAGLMVVSEGKTQREDVVRSIELLRDLKIVGTVLNGAREKAQTYY
jgi:capsular exopolysaccharide synthesis family protein